MAAQQVSFTVVVPTHKGRVSVLTAVQSILAQTHSNFELIVVSDGEGRRTRQLLGPVTDQRLRIIEQPKRGASAARNLGVASGTADWVTFLDDDDTVRPNWLEFWASEIDIDVAVVTGQIAFWRAERLTHVWDNRLLLDDMTMNASTILPGGFVIRRDLFDAVQGFDEALTYSENQDLGLRLCDHISTYCPEQQIKNTDKIVADFNREAANTRVHRYQSAPADSARVFLTRYAHRLNKDRHTASALHRIISRSERIQLRYSSAIKEAFASVRIHPSNLRNTRALVIALASCCAVPIRAVIRLVKSEKSSPKQIHRSHPH